MLDDLWTLRDDESDLFIQIAQLERDVEKYELLGAGDELARLDDDLMRAYTQLRQVQDAIADVQRNLALEDDDDDSGVGDDE